MQLDVLFLGRVAGAIGLPSVIAARVKAHEPSRKAVFEALLALGYETITSIYFVPATGAHAAFVAAHTTPDRDVCCRECGTVCDVKPGALRIPRRAYRVYPEGRPLDFRTIPDADDAEHAKGCAAERFPEVFRGLDERTLVATRI